MQKDQAYHESAIEYNEGLADAAETLATTLKHEEVRRWCEAVGKQHRFHARRHRSALEKLLKKETPEPVEQVADGLDVPEPTLGPAAIETIETVNEAVEEAPPIQGAVLEDGCVMYHNPTLPECNFYPGGANG